MSIFKKVFLFSFLFVFGAFFTTSVSAMTPRVSFSVDPNNSNTVQMNVTGDANTGVLFKYTAVNSSGPQLTSIGTTNASGNYSTSLNLNSYNIVQNSAVSVIVNGQMSPNVAWTFGNTTNTNLTLSQASTVINVGQSTTITASNNGSNALYLSSNTNPQVANISFRFCDVSNCQ